jgi:phenylalanine-4-hydroxylase
MATTTEPVPVELPADHPGVSDPAYRSRRARIAEVGGRYRPGQPIPDVAYTSEEDAVWRTVSAELALLHRDHACAEYQRAAAILDLPKDRVPQLREVDERVRSLTGFGFQPVPGLVPIRDFYGALAERRFLSTQYVRHPSAPFYTPEPDIIHEVIGHANMLATPVFADLYERAGRASRRARRSDSLEFFSRVFWFSLEFGVLREGGELRAYGAGLLSSYGEIQAFRGAEIRCLDVAAMGAMSYDITRFQPVLFAAGSLDEVIAVLGSFFDDYDDSTGDRHRGER